MSLTNELLSDCMPNASDRAIQKYLSPLNKFMPKYHINSVNRIAGFLAQIAHESGSLFYVEEIASGSAYEYRNDLGNLETAALKIAHSNYTTTGRFYRGRGLFQITGYYNYKECGKALGIPLDTNPKLLLLPDHAVESACWFWNNHNCNIYMDVGNFDKTTRIINGGTNGAAERTKFYNNNLKVLRDLRC